MITTDVLVIGAGPVGLFSVFELGLLGLRAHVVEAMPAVGGQCVELYPDKPIYDIPALPVCGARELVERLTQQIQPFAPVFHTGETVVRVAREADGRFVAETSGGLMICLSEADAHAYIAEITAIESEPAWIVGRVTEGGGRAAKLLDDFKIIEV